jgi:hypothetical protein
LRDGQLVLNAEITTALLAMLDAVRQMLGSIGATGSEGERNDRELIATLTELLRPKAEASPVADRVLDKKEEPAATPVPVPSVGDILIKRGAAKVSEVLEAVEQQVAGATRGTLAKSWWIRATSNRRTCSKP